MQAFEYKAVPAPARGTKAKGVRTTEDRFALSVTQAINEMAAEGWDYVRAETLPCDERKGLTGTQTTMQNLLIFRRRLRVDTQGDAAPLRLTPAAEAEPLRREPTVSRPVNDSSGTA